MKLVKRTLQMDSNYHSKMKMLSVIEGKDIYKLVGEAIDLFLDHINLNDEDTLIVTSNAIKNSTITTYFTTEHYKQLSLAAINLKLWNYEILNILALKLFKHYNLDIK